MDKLIDRMGQDWRTRRAMEELHTQQDADAFFESALTHAIMYEVHVGGTGIRKSVEACADFPPLPDVRKLARTRTLPARRKIAESLVERCRREGLDAQLGTVDEYGNPTVTVAWQLPA